MVQVNLDVDGMMCGQCEAHVKDAIRKQIPQAKALKANHTSGVASFRLENAASKDEINGELATALAPWGYKATVSSIEEVAEKEKKGGFFHFGKKK